MQPVVRQYYKALSKIIIKLPLSKELLLRVKQKTKQEFVTGPNFDRKRYNSYISLFKSVLDSHKCEALHDLLDVIYKRYDVAPWKKTFLVMPSLQLKPYWPQVHLIDELVPRHEKYDEFLQAQQNEDASVIKHFGLSGSPSPISGSSPKPRLIRHYSHSSTDYEHIMKEVTKLFDFLYQNQSHLDINVKPMEAVYRMTRIGMPLPVNNRDDILKQAIGQVKVLFHRYKPMKEQDLSDLIDFSLNHNEKINKYFHKYRQQQSRSKAKLIPNDHNIRKLIRSYAMKQYYIDDQDQAYTLSKMRNFYMNKQALNV